VLLGDTLVGNSRQRVTDRNQRNVRHGPADATIEPRRES
jgi:hypothetical protein